MTRFTSDVGRIAGELPDALAIIEADGATSWVNQAAVDLCRLEPAHWIGRSVLELLHPDDHGPASAVLGPVGDPERRSSVAVRLKDGTDQWRRMEIRSRHVHGGGAAAGFTVLGLRDLAGPG